MKTYFDRDGLLCRAVQLTKPALLQTAEGLKHAEPGQWVMSVDGHKLPFVLPDEKFSPFFTPLE